MCANKRGNLLEEQLDGLLCGGSGRGVMGGAQGDPPGAHNVISFNTAIKRNKVAKSSTINAEASNAETSKDAL